MSNNKDRDIEYYKSMDLEYIIDKLIFLKKSNRRWKKIAKTYRYCLKSQIPDKILFQKYENLEYILVSKADTDLLYDQIENLKGKLQKMEKDHKGRDESLKVLTSERSKWLRKLKRDGYDIAKLK